MIVIIENESHSSSGFAHILLDIDRIVTMVNAEALKAIEAVVLLLWRERMILKCCNKGHYYDGDKYQNCPHCLEEGQSLQKSKARHILKRKTSIKNSSAEMSVNVSQHSFQSRSSSSEESMTMCLPSNDEELMTMCLPSNDKESMTMCLPSNDEESMTMCLPSNDEESMTMCLPSNNDDSLTVCLPAKQHNSLERLPQAGSLDIFLAEQRLTAGWFVCINGKEFGRSFAVKNGKNLIGHAVVYYLMKHNKFMIEPGDTRNLFYLNEEPVLNPVEMKRHDILKIGGISLMLVPLCGKDFSWTELIKTNRERSL